MAQRKRPRKRTTYKRMSTEDALRRRLYLTLGGLFATTLLVIIGLNFFGPQIGSFFLLISKNKDNTGPEDVMPPTAPIFSQTPETTNEKTITLNGITEPGASIYLFVNGPKKGETIADNDGAFTFVDIELGEGNNIIFAKAIDESKNESEKSRVLTIAFDDEKPKIEITTPQDGDEIRNLNRRVLVQGKLNEDGEVKINGRQAVIKPDHSFELLLGVDEGDVQIIVEATDKAGNVAQKIITINYEKSS